MTAPPRREREFEPVYHHYGPHRAGLPPMAPYIRELWHRRAFAVEMSKAVMRGANTSTFFGQLWLILNPLLLAGVYYLLVTVIRGSHNPAFFAHLCLNLFAFNLVATASPAVPTGDQIWQCDEHPYPRLLSPLSADAPLLSVPAHVPGTRLHLILLTKVWKPRCCCSVRPGHHGAVRDGLRRLLLRLQVYFRDTSSFLPYFVRVWLYLSPVLWKPDHIEGVLSPTLLTLVKLNPMYSMLGGYSELLQGPGFPPLYMWLTAAAWAVVVAAIGFLFFISREREFTVRLV